MKRTWKQTVGKKGSVQSSLCPAPVRRPFKWKYCHASRRGGRLGKVRLRPRRPHVSGCFRIRNFFYPGYHRFFSRAAGIFGVGRRPTNLRPWAEATRGEAHYKDLTKTGNRARKVSGTRGTTFSFRIQKFPRLHVSAFKLNLPVHPYLDVFESANFSFIGPSWMNIHGKELGSILRH